LKGFIYGRKINLLRRKILPICDKRKVSVVCFVVVLRQKPATDSQVISAQQMALKLLNIFSEPTKNSNRAKFAKTFPSSYGFPGFSAVCVCVLCCEEKMKVKLKQDLQIFIFRLLMNLLAFDGFICRLSAQRKR